MILTNLSKRTTAPMNGECAEKQVGPANRLGRQDSTHRKPSCLDFAIFVSAARGLSLAYLFFKKSREAASYDLMKKLDSSCDWRPAFGLHFLGQTSLPHEFCK